MNSPRRRLGVFLALLAVAIVASLLLFRRLATTPPAPPAPTPRISPPRDAVSTPPAAVELTDPELADLVVTWCPEVDAPRELFVALGYLDTWHVEPVVLSDPCPSPGERPGSCRYQVLDRGRYLAIQGPFSRSGFLEDDGTTTLDLGCMASCGATVVVHAVDGCATQGTFELVSGWSEASRSVLVSVTWQADVPFSLRDLACLPTAYVEIRAEGCEPLDENVSFIEATANLSFEVVTAGRLMIQVVDAETGEPIQGAVLMMPGRPPLEPSDADGWIGPYAQDPADPYPLLYKTGYAQRDIPEFKFDEDGIFVARMYRPTPLQVRCDDNGAPCPPSTRMSVQQSGWEAGFRRCTRSDDWTWSCDVVEGDRARACAEQRCSERERLHMEGGDTVFLPPLDGTLCLTWPEETAGPCTLSFAEAEDASEPPCRTCAELTATSGAPSPVALEPGSTVQVSLVCADSAWSGETTVGSSALDPCATASPQPLGIICAGDFGSCWAHAGRAELRLRPSFNGCSKPIPAGPWSVNCGGIWYDVDLPPGETVDVTGAGETLEEKMQRSREEEERPSPS